MAEVWNDASHLARELIARESLFDQPDYIWDEDSFEAEIAPDFTKVGASGALYSREDIKAVVLGRLAGTHAISLTGGYRIVDPEAVRLVDGANPRPPDRPEPRHG